jgi:hypothetical protein
MHLADPNRYQHMAYAHCGRMWPGPYGEGGSRKYLLASELRRIDQYAVDGGLNIWAASSQSD